ncbi:hypothetical protein [Rhizobium sp. BK176]|uniref:hypothetical protein n=1 Tax=Rhizobium sp. BK176 TaxID=2587071 RepID=UPI002167BD32|nr:hypothetical protein [Rhizobium sp. BK176]MCS4089882.1 hypothetical protein [Rhizobium sp. BK176]
MPIDDRKFRFAPHCTLASLAYVNPIVGGRWQATNDGGDVSVLTEADFNRRCQLIAAADHGEGVYSIVAPTELGVVRKYVLNTEDKTVSLEGFEEPIALDEFRKMAVRATADGRILASFAETLSKQMDKCKESRLADDHLMDIREMATVYGDSTDRFELLEHHMYNVDSGELSDGLDFMAVMAKISAIGNPAGPTHKRFGLDQVVEGWHEVREHPNYMKTQVRYLFDMFMRDMLGNFPDDRVTMICAQSGTEEAHFSEKLEEAGFDLAGMLPPFEGRNALTGYRTGDVAFHRAKGVDVVVFNDFMGTYAYAWPTEEGGKLEMPAATTGLQIGGFKF